MNHQSNETIDRFLQEFTFDDRSAGDARNSGVDGRTRVEPVTVDGRTVRRWVNEFWTSRQRQASSLQEISYRACFKPQLPRFFIDLLTDPGDLVYDPYSGRGTTAVEAALLGRRFIANDVNPLSRLLTRPRLFPPAISDLETRLNELPIDPEARADIDLSMFYDTRTLGEIVSLRSYLAERSARGEEDDLDQWIRMVATNRLTGHSRGFFSVYTLPPNQAVYPERQKKINEKRKQRPEYRDIRALILKKSKSLLRNLTAEQTRRLAQAGKVGRHLQRRADATGEIAAESVDLIVTSPPFMDVVQYPMDNWLRCWFNSLDADAIAADMTSARTVEKWSAEIAAAFGEFFRVVKSGGWIGFEVGEVKKRSVQLDEVVVPIGLSAGFDCPGIVINRQEFTKTSNIWGVDNNRRGTNTNRIVLFRKSPVVNS